MAHHAYYVSGDSEEGINAALSFVRDEFGIETSANPDVVTLRFGLMSVEDARALRALAELAPIGNEKILIISANRFFHEAQNALLKLFEEPPAHTTLVLVVPTAGILLQTLRSRLVELPKQKNKNGKHAPPEAAHAFLTASKIEREKMVTKILDRTRSDKDEEKQSARIEAVHLVEGLTTIAHGEWSSASPSAQRDIRSYLDDLSVFLPILHERSAPLKLIFEHILLTTPHLSLAK